MLGLVQPIRIDPIRFSDVVLSLYLRLGPRKAVLWSVLLREPWLAPMPDNSWANIDPWNYVAEKSYEFAQIARGLIGEVLRRKSAD